MKAYMYKGLLSLCMILSLCTSVFAYDECSYEPDYEYLLISGYKDIREKGIDDSFMVAFRVQGNTTPVVATAFEVEYSKLDKTSYIRAGFPVIFKIKPSRRFVFDVVLTPGALYLDPAFADSNDFEFALTTGTEIKFFYTKGYSIGVGAYWTLSSYEKINNLNGVLI
ncbi:MAG: hypothetical protein QW561_03635, partial [Candidatus Aenigmatarchaeota archaeon]